MLDCDGAAANGCETNGVSDGTNCGSCGHDCLGEACVDGACQAAMLIHASNTIADIALDATDVYFTAPDAGQVMVVSKTGGPFGILAYVESPGAIAVDDQDVFFATQTAVMKAAKTGGGYEVLAWDDTVADLAIDADFVYWVTDLDCGSVKRIPKTGNNGVTLASNQGLPWAVAVDESFVYWLEAQSNRVMKLDKSGAGVPVPLAVEPLARHLAVDGSDLYFTTSNGVATVVSTGGGAVTLAESSATAITTDDIYVYWVGAGIHRISKAGGAPERRTLGDAIGSAIAVDSTHVYFGESGRVLRSAK
jgi:hypothetical protein